jgi:hypothetical protein
MTPKHRIEMQSELWRVHEAAREEDKKRRMENRNLARYWKSIGGDEAEREDYEQREVF